MLISIRNLCVTVVNCAKRFTTAGASLSHTTRKYI